MSKKEQELNMYGNPAGRHASHRRPFNACWRLLDLPELTPRKYIQQGTQLKFW